MGSRLFRLHYRCICFRTSFHIIGIFYDEYTSLPPIGSRIKICGKISKVGFGYEYIETKAGNFLMKSYKIINQFSGIEDLYSSDQDAYGATPFPINYDFYREYQCKQ